MADFSANVDNPWFPLQPGSVRVFTGTKDGKAARDVYTVTRSTKLVDGVPTRVVQDKLARIESIDPAACMENHPLIITRRIKIRGRAR